jgi:Kef-type K+ transport system membrane component KefB
VTELGYISLVFALFVVPRVVQRWRVPRAITNITLGAVAGLGFGLFEGDTTLALFSTLGISTLFLFAGLEVRFKELAGGKRVLVQHVVVQLVLTAGVAAAAIRIFGLDFRPAVLLALALLTPSAGFILDSLGGFGLSPDQVFWVRSKTIATEIVSLLLLFFVLQSSSAARFVLGTSALAAMIFLLPAVFRMFAIWIAPIAPRSEFAFLVMVTIGAAYVTRQLGAYYLVGAFVVGVVAQRFRERMPAVASEEMLHAVDVFASFFIPFYFFAAGLHLTPDVFSLRSLAIGAAMLGIMVPLRVASVAVHRRLSLGEPLAQGWRVGTSLVPTLVFTLVTAEIMRDRLEVPAALFGGLVIYTLGNTLIPGFALHTPAPEYDDPSLPRVDVPAEAAS